MKMTASSNNDPSHGCDSTAQWLRVSQLEGETVVPVPVVGVKVILGRLIGKLCINADFI